MSALKLYDAGFRELVSVIPPEAPLAPTSTVDEKNRGKAPGKKGKKGWYGYDFINATPPSREEAASWAEDGANIGLRADRFPGLDIDVDNAKLSAAIGKFAHSFLGSAPVRLSRGSRALLVYRTSAPFARHAMIVEYEGGHHLVEFLCAGRQYLVYGKHPSGVDYQWSEPPLWGSPASLLTEVTEETVVGFFGALEAALTAKGVTCERVSRGKAADSAPPQDLLRAPSVEYVRTVVGMVPNPATARWEQHVQMGHAVRAACGEENADEAREIWEEWCEKWEGVAESPRARWESMSPPHRVGWNWLQEQAEAGTPEYSSAQDDFEADPALAHLAEAEAAKAEREPGLPRVRFTEEWAADYLLPTLREKLRFVPGTGDEGGAWRIWNGHAWAEDDRLHHEIIIREQLRRLSIRLNEAGTNAATKEEGKHFIGAARRFQSKAGITAVVGLIRAHVAVTPTDFDVDPMLLNTPAGVVDLRTGEVGPATPEGMHSRATAVAPVAGPHPLWSRFLEDLTGGDQEFVDFLQRFLGYGLTGMTTEKVLGYAWGSNSDTGKSTFVRVMDRLFGTYADTVDIESFITSKKKEDRIPADLARLPGVRLVTATEPETGHAWSEKRIKAITGGDLISARFLHRNWFTYQPQFLIFAVGNNEPELRNVDDAMLRRILILPFNRKVPRERQIENLSERVVAEEGPAVLQWLIDGCVAWQRDGLNPPAVVRDRTAEYAEGQDTVATWAEEQLETGADFTVSRHDLFRAWAQWKRSRDEYPGKEGSFKETFRPVAEKLGAEDNVFVQVGDARRRGYRGIRLRPRIAAGTAGDDFQ